MIFTSSYGQLSVVIPYVLAAPYYFSARSQLGTHDTDGRRVRARRGGAVLLHHLYATLADYKAVIDRLTTFDRRHRRRRGRVGREAGIRLAGATRATRSRMRDLSLALPDGAPHRRTPHGLRLPPRRERRW